MALGALQKDEAGETRSLPMFDYVVSCVPIRVLVLAQSAADKEVVGYDASAPEFGIWISAPADVSKALRAEVTNSTLFLDFVDGDFATDQPIKLVIKREGAY